MRKSILITVVLSSTLFLTSCATKSQASPIALLEKSWTQSPEEKTSDDIEIYRSSDSRDFPASRYRQILEFEDNDVCNYLVLSPNDGHYMETGNWEFDDKTNSITISNSDSEIIYEFELVELTEDILKLKVKN